MSIGIFLIATGKYIDFIESLCNDINKYFLTGYKKDIYVFTDSKNVPECVTKIYQKHIKWPTPTLFRYHYIYEFCKKNDVRHDYYYYLDADMKIVDYVGKEILGDFVVTQHPGFYDKSKTDLYYEKKFLSQAYISPNKINGYYAGGFNGGKKYLEISKQIIKWIDIDQKYNFTPLHNDETYLQKAIVKYKPDIILSSEYCYPDLLSDIKRWGLTGLIPKIIAITKTKEYK